MGILDIPDSFHRDNVLSVDANQRCNASIYRGMVYLLGGGVEVGDYLFDTSDRQLILQRASISIRIKYLPLCKHRILPQRIPV